MVRRSGRTTILTLCVPGSEICRRNGFRCIEALSNVRRFTANPAQGTPVVRRRIRRQIAYCPTDTVSTCNVPPMALHSMALTCISVLELGEFRGIKRYREGCQVIDGNLFTL